MTACYYCAAGVLHPRNQARAPIPWWRRHWQVWIHSSYLRRSWGHPRMVRLLFWSRINAERWVEIYYSPYRGGVVDPDVRVSERTCI